MLTVETVIVAIWVASVAAVLAGACGVMREWAKAGDPPPPRYAGHHHRPVPPLSARIAAALLDVWREMAAAHALMTGAATMHPAVLIGG